jgi:cell cycle checkpoint protein
VTTVCNLNTYESDNIDEIPFDRDELLVKVIMQSRYLYDAISEISAMTQTGATSDSRLTILASPRSPYLVLSALGTYGSTSVDFSKSRELLDTFTVASRWSQSYKFEMIKGAYEAMRLASKVSLRSDQQGVLSLQFMVENDTGGVSFIEFRFVPYIGDDDESGSEGEEEADE